MRKILIPADILEVAGLPPPTDFRWFARVIVDSQEEANKDAAGLRAGARIDAALADDPRVANPAAQDCVLLEEHDWQLLKRTVEAPTKGYPINPARKLLPFINAICDASEE